MVLAPLHGFGDVDAMGCHPRGAAADAVDINGCDVVDFVQAQPYPVFRLSLVFESVLIVRVSRIVTDARVGVGFPSLERVGAEADAVLFEGQLPFAADGVGVSG